MSAGTAPMESELPAQAVDTDTYIEIQRFMSEEAALLDRSAYAEWFALLTDDVSYRISNCLVRDRDEDTHDFPIVDEDREHLKLRVDQLSDPKLTKAENPASLHRRFVTNLRADYGDRQETFAVTTNLLVYKNRTSYAQVDLYAAERFDLLERKRGRLHIARRYVRLDQSVLVGGTLSTIL